MGIAEMRADTDQFLSQWGETLTRKRLTSGYDANGRSNGDYTTISDTFSGDWQPLSGKTKLKESGLETSYDSKIITVYDADVLEDDQIHRADGTFMWVTHVAKYEDHMTIFLNKTKGD